MKVAIYGNANKLNLDAQMRIIKIAELNAQIYSTKTIADKIYCIKVS